MLKKFKRAGPLWAAKPATTRPSDSRAARPRVVIVGAGFGGLTAARALAGADLDITLVDRRNHHLFQPLLYQVATAGLDGSEIAWPVRAILAPQRNATVLMDEARGVDVARGLVRCASHPPLAYDYLIVATGARHAYFGNSHWEPFAPGLKSIEDAIALRRRILTAFERAETTHDAAARDWLLSFVVVGGGPTGVEMAGALAELAHRSLSREFRRIDPRQARIHLVEAGPRVLPAFPQSLSAYARRALERLGVEVRTAAAVTNCDAEGVALDGARLPAATVIWAAGVQASAAGHWLGAATDRAGRVAVAADLSLPGHPEVFVVGDTAAVSDADGRPVPGIAPAAKQQGRHVARCIRRELDSKRQRPRFVYRHYGNLATIGRHAAVIHRGRLRLTGRLAWWLWGIAHIYFLIGARAPLLVATEWLWSYLTAGKGVRLIVGSERCVQPLTAGDDQPE